jgi:UDP-N-acetylglucosamine--N-acetylmuramyl-(pentapeptide) pyrophosphoryl-undecaprenol N-acetylglucosamine transferase
MHNDAIDQLKPSRKTVMIAAGGTGGHVFPALAVAQGLRAIDLDVVWLGTRKGIESKIVPENKFVIHFINVAGVRGKNLLSWIKAPILLMMAVISSVSLIRKTKPCCVLGMGGFASAAAGFAAFICRVPLILQEQNSIPGTTNRLLAPLATKIFTGFPAAFKASAKSQFSGNPLRAALYQIDEPSVRMAADASPLRLLILGGSLGAHALNCVLPKALAQLRSENTSFNDISVVHQTGVNDVEDVQQQYVLAGIDAAVSAFITDMPQAYSNADLVIARSGALTVTELAAAGVASLLIPYPYATDDHQTANANWLVDVGAATLVSQADFSVDKACHLLAALLQNRKALLNQAQQARSLATPSATQIIVNACQEFSYV